MTFNANWSKAGVWIKRVIHAPLRLDDLYLAYVLCLAGLAKLRSYKASRLEIDRTGVPVLVTQKSTAVTNIVSIAEVFVAAASLIGWPSRTIARTVRSALFAIFCVYRIQAFRSSKPCSCFGPRHEVVSGYDVGVAISWCGLSVVGMLRGRTDSSLPALSLSDRIK